MHVASILSNKGRTVITAHAGATVSEIAQILSAKKIGAVVVVDDADQVTGIVSERDVVNGLARHGQRLLDMQISEVMTRDVVTCAPDLPIDDVMKEMTVGRIRHLPVIEGGRLAGIISIGDVVKFRLDALEEEAQQLKRYIATG